MQVSSVAVDDLIAQLRAVPGAPPPPAPPVFPPSDGSGNSGGMEPRVAKLEAHMEHVRAELTKLATLPVEIATIRTKVDHLPGKGFVVTAATGTVVALSGLLVLLQKLGILH